MLYESQTSVEQQFEELPNILLLLVHRMIDAHSIDTLNDSNLCIQSLALCSSPSIIAVNKVKILSLYIKSVANNFT
jgi:hypothetical protein